MKNSLLAIMGLLALSACNSGLDHKLLQTPEGVLTEVSKKEESQYSSFAVAFHRAINDKLPPPDNIVERNQELMGLVDAIEGQKTTCAVNSGAISQIKAVLNQAEGLVGSKVMDSHLEVLDKLSAFIRVGGGSQKIVEDLNSCATTSYDPKELALKWERTLKSRLMLEAYQIRCAVLLPVSQNAGKMLDASIKAMQATKVDTNARFITTHIKTLIEFLRYARSCTELDGSLAQAYMSAIDNLYSEVIQLYALPTAELEDREKLNEVLQILVSQADVLHKGSMPQLKKLAHALLELDVNNNSYLSKNLEPLSLNEDSLLTIEESSPMQIKAELEKSRRFITMAVPLEEEIHVYAEYFALEGQRVFSIDLQILGRSAQSLQLNATQFIDWVGFILSKSAEGLEPKPIVVLKGLSALNYDTSIKDQANRQSAMAQNLRHLESVSSAVNLLVPVIKENEHLFQNSEVAEESRLALSPLNLELSEKVIAYIVKENNLRANDKFLWRHEPYRIMAKVYRSFQPNGFYMSQLIKMCKEFDQRRLADQSGFNDEKEDDLALLVAERTLSLKRKKILRSPILGLTGASIEWRLKHDRDKFLLNKSVHKNEIIAKSNEVARGHAEGIRIRSEQQRVDAENRRRADELARASNLRNILGNFQTVTGWIAQADTLFNAVRQVSTLLRTDVDNINNNMATILEKMAELKQEMKEAQLAEVKILLGNMTDTILGMLDEKFAKANLFGLPHRDNWKNTLANLKRRLGL